MHTKCLGVNNVFFFRKKEMLPENILKTISHKHLVRRYLILLISLFVSALAFNLLQLPTRIVSGGTNGIAIICDYLFKLEPSLVILIVSIVLLILSFIFLGVEQTSGAVVATLVYPLFVQLTSHVTTYVKVDSTDLILLSVFIGIIGGITTGMNYRVGFSNGGLNIISQILYKYQKLSISKTTFFINFIIVVIGGIYFGWTMVMYAIIIIYVNSIVMNRMLLGVSKNKAFYVITSEEAKVKEYILNKLQRGVTVFDVKGGFAEKRNHVLMTVVPNNEYFRLTEGVKEIDEGAFFVAFDAYESSVSK